MVDPVIMGGLYGSPGAKVQQTAISAQFVGKSQLFCARLGKLQEFLLGPLAIAHPRFSTFVGSSL